jgi:hypothetical protein
MSPDQPPITAVCTGIGRGHPNYLDSVLRHIRQIHPAEYRQIRVIAVPEISRGLSRIGWKAVEAVYRAGSRGGATSFTYTRLRTRHSGYDPGSLSTRLLGRDLRACLSRYSGVCLVAHPLLAAILKGTHRVFYLHGEIAAPRESAIRGIERIYVPLPETKAGMVARGIGPESVLETGLVLEPEILSDLDGAVERRIQRIMSGGPLTVGFFISGAYPRHHISMITSAVRSCTESGLRVRLFWGTDPRQANRLIAALHEFASGVVVDSTLGRRRPEAELVVITGRTREEETVRSTAYLPDLDVFCAAPHERVNWAAGAGLPMVMIGPPIGSFAPENRGYILRAGCGVEFSSPDRFADFARELRTLRDDGRLLQMVAAGRKVSAVEGAKTIANDLLSIFTEQTGQKDSEPMG